MTYSTKEVADLFSIHPNTVLFYEKMGYLAPVERRNNNYRIFTELHVKQLQIIKRVYLKEWPGKRIRQASVEIIKGLPGWDLPALRKRTGLYISTIESELAKVKRALDMYKNGEDCTPKEGQPLPYAEAAKVLHITKDTLRNWERNNLFSSRRGRGNRKYITPDILDELQVIYALRLAGFSMSAVYAYLHDPGSLDSLEIFTAGDHLLEFLNLTLERAKEIYTFLI